MDLLTVTIVSSLLLLAAGVLMLSHVRAWRAFRRQLLDAETEDFDYRRRQFRRRMQTSAMLGLLAVALPVGIVLTNWLGSGWFVLFYCLAMIVVVFWVILLALVDAWATKHHYGRLRHQCLVEKLKLEAEIRRIQSVKGNGEATDQGTTDV